jgi:pyruvate dehydrogenase E2 component (dihydrolipoamide acetyltransferase)
MRKLIEIHVPDIGDYSDVPVIEVLDKVGDAIEKEQSVVTLESDKATMDVPSSHAGIVKEIKVKVGDLISEGALVLVVESSDAAATPAPVASAPAAPKAAQHASLAPGAHPLMDPGSADPWCGGRRGWAHRRRRHG